jgi:predicted nucleotidyltransferase
MIKKSQLNIINLFRKNIFLKKTIREISMLLKKEELLTIETIGKSKVCSAKLDQKTVSLFCFLDEQESFEANIPNICKILDFKEFNEDLILITGSYVLGKQTKTSDIDLVLIVKEKAFEKQKLLENITSLMIPKIHALVFSQKDFIDMLLDKKPNFGKEIFNKHLIFKNTVKYYDLIKEAIEHGFRG